MEGPKTKLMDEQQAVEAKEHKMALEYMIGLSEEEFCEMLVTQLQNTPRRPVRRTLASFGRGLEEYLHNVPEGLILIEHKVVTWINGPAEKLLQTTAEELNRSHMGLAQFISRDQWKPLFRAQMEGLSQNGWSYMGPVRFEVNGKKRVYSMSCHLGSPSPAMDPVGPGPQTSSHSPTGSSEDLGSPSSPRVSASDSTVTGGETEERLPHLVHWLKLRDVTAEEEARAHEQKQLASLVQLKNRFGLLLDSLTKALSAPTDRLAELGRTLKEQPLELLNQDFPTRITETAADIRTRLYDIELLANVVVDDATPSRSALERLFPTKHDARGQLTNKSSTMSGPHISAQNLDFINLVQIMDEVVRALAPLRSSKGIQIGASYCPASSIDVIVDGSLVRTVWGLLASSLAELSQSRAGHTISLHLCSSPTGDRAPRCEHCGVLWEAVPASALSQAKGRSSAVTTDFIIVVTDENPDHFDRGFVRKVVSNPGAVVENFFSGATHVDAAPLAYSSSDGAPLLIPGTDVPVRPEPSISTLPTSELRIAAASKLIGDLRGTMFVVNTANKKREGAPLDCMSLCVFIPALEHSSLGTVTLDQSGDQNDLAAASRADRMAKLVLDQLNQLNISSSELELPTVDSSVHSGSHRTNPPIDPSQVSVVSFAENPLSGGSETQGDLEHAHEGSESTIPLSVHSSTPGTAAAAAAAASAVMRGPGSRAETSNGEEVVADASHTECSCETPSSKTCGCKKSLGGSRPEFFDATSYEPQGAVCASDLDSASRNSNLESVEPVEDGYGPEPPASDPRAIRETVIGAMVPTPMKPSLMLIGQALLADVDTEFLSRYVYVSVKSDAVEAMNASSRQEQPDIIMIDFIPQGNKGMMGQELLVNIKASRPHTFISVYKEGPVSYGIMARFRNVVDNWVNGPFDRLAAVELFNRYARFPSAKNKDGMLIALSSQQSNPMEPGNAAIVSVWLRQGLLQSTYDPAYDAEVYSSDSSTGYHAESIGLSTREQVASKFPLNDLRPRHMDHFTARRGGVTANFSSQYSFVPDPGYSLHGPPKPAISAALASAYDSGVLAPHELGEQYQTTTLWPAFVVDSHKIRQAVVELLSHGTMSDDQLRLLSANLGGLITAAKFVGASHVVASAQALRSCTDYSLLGQRFQSLDKDLDTVWSLMEAHGVS